MSTNRYEPWSLLQRFQDDVNRLLEEQAYGGAAADSSRIATSQWTPAVDIREEPDRFVLYADLPGVDVSDIEITMEGGVLTISGTRAWRSDEPRDAYRRVERARGSFYRRFSLPDTADAEGVKAAASNGVLEVSIAKKQQAQPRRIAVSG